ncbi:MAG: glycosyl transferase [Clostridia bacterium]|nr:glycosyl transferase [Clostridia bacterium]
MIRIEWIIVILFAIYVFNKYNPKNAKKNKKASFDAALSGSELLEYAVQMATMDKSVYNNYSFKKLLRQLKFSFRYISDVYEFLRACDEEFLPPASEWLLDNYYVIEKETQSICDDMQMRKKIYLPVSATGEYEGYPRIYEIASRMVSHSQGIIDEEALIKFIQSYQSVKELTSNEIWILPVMIQIVLIENIEQLCRILKSDVLLYEKAEKLYGELKKYSDTDKSLEERFRDYFKSKNDMDEVVIERLLLKLKRYDKSMVKVNDILDEYLIGCGLCEEDIILKEHKRQSLNQIYMGNCIISLNCIRMISNDSLYENLSRVEKILQSEPSGTYKIMEKESKDVYRNAIKSFSAKYKMSEVELANAAVELGKDAESDKKRHVGYYFISGGKTELLKKLRIKEHFCWIKKYKQSLYVAAIIGFSLILDAAFISALRTNFPIVLFLLCFVPVSEISVKIINFILLKLLSVSHIPKIDIKDGIPENAATLVVIPALITSEESSRHLAENLEKFYIANKDKNLHFAILGDFKDAAEQHDKTDGRILDKTRNLIEALNEKYKKEQANFLYFHRERTFYPQDKKWMGYERKRGALQELVSYIKGERSGIQLIACARELPEIKYIITLDSDTQLHFGVAKRMIGAMLHPLNMPEIDSEKNIVTNGYAIMQPRIDVTLESANKSIFSMIFAGDGGVDPYSCSTSDLYQDVFGMGIFTGKGIFDVDIYHKVLHQRLPDSAILSHDLLEGLYLRNGFVGDEEFTDGYPSSYKGHIKRLHRWVRGDWQLLPWLKRKIPMQNGVEKNPFSLIDKWKIMDNMRRSIHPVFSFAVFAAAVLLLKTDGIGLFVLGIVSMGFSVINAVLDELSQGKLLRRHCFNRFAVCGAMRSVYEFIFNLAFLPYQAHKMCDAIIRTLWRLYVTHKNMLEWVTSADSEKNAGKNEQMIINFIAGILMILLGKFSVFPTILGILWFFAPFADKVLSKDIHGGENKLSDSEKQYLRLLSRKIWAYYEDFAGESENYLPPDNVQIEPPNGIAHRTSPTNIGVLMIAYLAAWDFGYITMSDMLSKIEKTLDSIDKLPKWNGHLYNWYNTKTLSVMPPEYVSTVDNGNYIGYMMTLKEGLLNLKNEPLIGDRIARGILDTAALGNIDTFSADELFGEQKKEKWIETINKVLGQKFDVCNIWHRKTKHFLLSVLKEVDADKDVIISRIDKIIQRIDHIIHSTDFSLLYDDKRKLFSIGFDVLSGHLTKGYYDLFASEARQTSFVAIAKGDIDCRHWFKTARNLVSYKKNMALVSWTGTMFEYLMPALIMKSPTNSLLYKTYQSVVKSHMEYVKEKNIPWGISESGFFAFDMNMNYQYKATGIPQLALKRGLEKDMIISPYSSIMAAMIKPREAAQNIKRLERLGAGGDYGLYEAVDFTPKRLKQDELYAIVKSYMVHHMGMSLLALDNAVNDYVMQGRFHQSPMVKAAEYLLEERLPQKVRLRRTPVIRDVLEKQTKSQFYSCRRIVERPNVLLPKAHIISNGSYSVVLNALGASFASCGLIDVTRRGSEPQDYASIVYIRDVDKNIWYHSGYNNGGEYRAIFEYDRAEFENKAEDVKITTTVCVAPDDNAEIRRITVSNFQNMEKNFELTSYQEIVLDKEKSYEAHPAFSKLFVRTEYNEKYNALIACRRPREEGGIENLAMHMSVTDNSLPIAEYETDRLKFLGRNRNTQNPQALSEKHILSNTTGAVVDPIFSMRVKVRVPSGKSISVYFITAFSQNTDELLSICSKYSSLTNTEAVFENSARRAYIEQKYLSLSNGEEEDLLSILPHLLYTSGTKESISEKYLDNKLGQSGLWSMGISGDMPVVLFEIERIEDIDTLKRMLKCHEYYRIKGYRFDLVILCMENASYTNPLFKRVQEEVAASHARELVGAFGGVFIIARQNIKEEEHRLLIKVARVVLYAKYKTLSESFVETEPEEVLPDVPNTMGEEYPVVDVCLGNMNFFNGFGGFEGDEYVIRLKNNDTTPLPWINVIANPSFGCLASESGGGYTWHQNSRENKLTLWSNDPVADKPSEVLYLRDNDCGYVWTVTSRPLGDNGEYVIRHGFGYTSYTHASNGISAEQTIFVPVSDNVKIILLTVKNMTDKKRNLSACYYLKPVMGASSEYSRYIKTGYDGVLTFENLYNSEFPNQKGFLTSSEGICEFTTDNTEFRSNKFGVPYALYKNKLSGKTGTGYDMCAAVKNEFIVEPYKIKKLVYLFGEDSEVSEIVQKYASVKQAEAALEEVKRYWRNTVCSIQVQTPDPSLDYMVNGRLLYQTIACRLFARSAFYQSGGAYGFRDQLQDSMAALYHIPQITRERIIDHARHQFIEGDVQHWWHKSSDNSGCDKGIRTKFSDDLLWLAYVVCEYILVTEDESILDEQAEYIKGCLLDENTDEKYFIPEKSGILENIYLHCARAIDKSALIGSHGLALMGSGDWNDGMNTVGNKGRGESVWLSWFLCDILKKFYPICEKRGDFERAEKYRELLESLSESLNTKAWDGGWYLRAFFDDGTPLGSVENTECRIDSISQSWSILSGIGDSQKTIKAIEAVQDYLICEEDSIIKLLTPAFDKSNLSPGYIKSYLSGIRENGGQYTHAAIWLVMAFARLGMGDKTHKYFSMLNPINHARTDTEAMRYKVEPYAIAADVYSNVNQMGRGGWTWYTGAAGWFYKAAVEEIFGIKKRGEKLIINPCVPSSWKDFTVKYKYKDGEYILKYENPKQKETGVSLIEIDGVCIEGNTIALIDDSKIHRVRIVM